MQTFHPPYRFASQATQIALFVALWLLADRLTRALHSGVPAGVLALFLVLGLLLARVVSQRHIEAGARRLLAELPLFFIPPLLSITESGAVFAQYGWSLIAALAIGSVTVMACTGLIVDCVFRFERRLRAGGKPIAACGCKRRPDAKGANHA
ncbi:MAG TPA: CidA/LrgA family protein [Burkholderiaceae bacterium]